MTAIRDDIQCAGVAKARRNTPVLSDRQAADNELVGQIAPALLTTEQAARYLSIKPATLNQWRSSNRKKLAFVKIGGQVRYRRTDLDAFINDGLRNASAS